MHHLNEAASSIICMYLAKDLAITWCHYSTTTVSSREGDIWVMSCAQFLLNLALCVGLQLLFSQIQECQAFALSLVLQTPGSCHVTLIMRGFYPFCHTDQILSTDILFFKLFLLQPLKCIFLPASDTHFCCWTHLSYSTWRLGALLKETSKDLFALVHFHFAHLDILQYSIRLLPSTSQIWACILNCTKFNMPHDLFCSSIKYEWYFESNILFRLLRFLNNNMQPEHLTHKFSKHLESTRIPV